MKHKFKVFINNYTCIESDYDFKFRCCVILIGGESFVELSKETRNREDADVSLITGKMRVIGQQETPELTSSAVVLRNEALAVATVSADTAGMIQWQTDGQTRNTWAVFNNIAARLSASWDRSYSIERNLQKARLAKIAPVPKVSYSLYVITRAKSLENTLSWLSYTPKQGSCYLRNFISCEYEGQHRLFIVMIIVIVLLYLRSPKGGCFSISDDLSYS